MAWTHIDSFSGIGGFALAARWVWGAEHEIITFIEKDEFCRQVLAKNFAGVPVHDDIKTFNGKPFAGSVDLFTGGFPCQPYSHAGERKGTADDRHLWPQMRRVVAEAKPRWIVGENVTGIIGLVLDDVLSDLEGEGYEARAFVIPACSKDAPHRRDRVWIVAHLDGQREHEPQGHLEEIRRWSENCRHQAAPDFEKSGLEGDEPAGDSRSDGCFAERRWRAVEPVVRRGVHGIPDRVDRIRALGNAIVPQVAYEIFMAIRSVDESGLRANLRDSLVSMGESPNLL
jgi:DNA (cytosine-5)-methyltransferase 1